MPDPVITELQVSGDVFGAGRGLRIFIVSEVETQGEAKTALLASFTAADEVYEGLPLREIDAEAVAAINAFRVTANYGLFEVSELSDGEFSVSFDTTGATERITQALAHVADFAPPGETAPNHNGAINVGPNGPEGIDIVGRKLLKTIQEPKRLDGTTPLGTQAAYEQVVAGLTGTVNSTAFLGYQPGELLFLGAGGRRRGKKASDLWDVTYQFLAAPGQTNLTIGSIPGIDRDGHEYLWFTFRDVEDENLNLVNRAVGAHVEQVYAATDFNSLGLVSA